MMMNRILLGLTVMAVLLFVPSVARADEPTTESSAAVSVAAVADPGVVVPVRWYGYRPYGGWYAPGYSGPYYTYRPYVYPVYPRYDYYYNPYPGGYYYYSPGFNFYRSGPRRLFGFAF
jgi:hypothetical protein